MRHAALQTDMPEVGASGGDRGEPVRRECDGVRRRHVLAVAKARRWWQGHPAAISASPPDVHTSLAKVSGQKLPFSGQIFTDRR